jgi:hypothetical protein
MAKEKNQGDESKPRQVPIPRPPSREDLDRVSGQQGMITDEWTGGPAAPKPEEGPEREAEGQPS